MQVVSIGDHGDHFYEISNLFSEKKKKKKKKKTEKKKKKKLFQNVVCWNYYPAC